MLDNILAVETPEGMDLELRVAGPVARSYAWLLDFLIRCGVLFAASTVFMILGNAGLGLLLILWFLLEWLYPVVFEVCNDGATPGKASMGLKVMRDDGTPVNWSSSLVRNLLRGVDMLPFFYGFGLVACLINRDFKRLGDLAAGTVVVYKNRNAKNSGLPQASALAPPMPLTVEEQHALVAYAERSATLSRDRLEELADIAEPLTGARASTSHQRLLQYANWLAGQR